MRSTTRRRAHAVAQEGNSRGGEYENAVTITTVDAKTAAQQREIAYQARGIVDGLISSGKVPAPEDYYKILSFKFSPQIRTDAYGDVTAGWNLRPSPAVNEGHITIFSPGAISLQEAIITYGHEVGHFNLDWRHSQVENYGQSIYKTYSTGEPYSGPKP